MIPVKTLNLAIQAAIRAGKKIMEIYHSEDFEVSNKADQSPLTLADRSAHQIISKALEQTGIPLLSEEGKEIAYDARKQWKQFWLVDPLDGTKEFIKKNDEFTVNIAMIENNTPIFGVVYAPALDDLYIGIMGKDAWFYNSPGEQVTFEEISKNGKKLSLNHNENKNTTYRVVASRSHLNEETEKYLQELQNMHGEIEIVSKGSSLKICMVAKGDADEYPRLGPTMEWDVAAAHAVVKASGKHISILGTKEELSYNKENLLNPYFLVK